MTAPEKQMLDRLADWVKNQGSKQQDRPQPWSWVTGLLVAAIAMLAIGFFYWRSWRQGKKIAKLLHEKDVQEQEAAKAKVDRSVRETNIEAARRRKRASEAYLRAQELDRKVKEASDHRTKTAEEIDALKNWRDVDRYLSGGGDGEG